MPISNWNYLNLNRTLLLAQLFLVSFRPVFNKKTSVVPRQTQPNIAEHYFTHYFTTMQPALKKDWYHAGDTRH
jgi:hypothetical protein